MIRKFDTSGIIISALVFASVFLIFISLPNARDLLPPQYNGVVIQNMYDLEVGEYAVIVEQGENKRFIVIGGPNGNYIPMTGESFALVTSNSLKSMREIVIRLTNDDNCFPVICRYDLMTSEINGIWNIKTGVSMFQH